MSGADRFAEDWKRNGPRYRYRYGYGYGSGSGSGSIDELGYGYGRGDSHGSDFGYGYGRGDGSGRGDGYGEGSGYGSGSGYGYGSSCECSSCDCYGDGSGDGSGYVDGVSEYNGRKAYMIDSVATIIDHVHGPVAKGRILRQDLTTVPCYIVKRDGLFAHGKTLREAMDALRDKLFENMPEKERIAEFIKAHKWGEKYSAVDFYDWHHRLTGSCEMGRREFAKSHGYSLKEDELLTVEAFIELTKDSYGGSVIRKLREAYGRKRR